jgi:hypothetical protein
MNANELADLLEVDSWYKLVTREEIAAMLRQQQAEIEALKRPNNVVGVPCDELKKMQDRLAHLDKMIVWYQDITMTGIKSEEYENGFWDAVGFVKQHQVKDMK